MDMLVEMAETPSKKTLHLRLLIRIQNLLYRFLFVGCLRPPPVPELVLGKEVEQPG